MHVAISGGSGFLGRALRRTLEHQGHRVSTLTRRSRPDRPGDIEWTPNGESGPWAEALAQVDAVVNLAGEGMADRRWSVARKQLLVESRVQATTSLVKAIQSLPRPPRVFLSGSGVGYYGARHDDLVMEDQLPGTDFVAQMALAWEQAAAPLVETCRVVYLRTGLVLGPGGALAKMRLPFSLGVGGRLGSGRQWMPWIHLDDWAGLTAYLLTRHGDAGPFNLTAPEPVTNAAFTKALGRELGRPTVFAVPAFALRLALGEMADMLLTGQRALPAAALAAGYTFRHTRLDDALHAALRR